MNKIKILHGFAALALLTGGSGCGLSTKTPTEEFTGKLGSNWDGQAPTLVQASSRKLYEVPIDNGEFRVAVLGGESYRFTVVRADGSRVPLLFPRAGGRTNERLAVSGGTSFDFGYLRYVAPFESATVQVSTRSSKSGELATDGEYECEDGIDPATGAACVEENDDAESCEGDDEGDGEHEDGDERDDDDIECENGLDARTGLACVDEDDDHVENREEAALPDHVPPSGVGNCNDDNVEQEGEHEG